MWINNPYELLDNFFIFIPKNDFSLSLKFNIISKDLILFSIILFIFTQNIFVLLTTIITLIILFFWFYKINKENFVSNNTKIIPLNTVLKDYHKIRKQNPFSNVLLTDIYDYPNRKSAPPAFNPEVYTNIKDKIKEMVQYLNPGIKNTNKQLFGDLGEDFNLTQSTIIFNSTPNTRVTNDQGAFGNYLYGNMPSCKDGSPFACVQDNYRWTTP
uniref:Minor capsid protein P9 transmembrane helices domain-containing protein n=1 Tax=viral metagenome TaxID=1070528 RepID=A0A6C0H510_9ZZZZ